MKAGAIVALSLVAGAALTRRASRKPAPSSPKPGPFQGDRTLAFAPPTLVVKSSCSGSAWAASLPKNQVDLGPAILAAVDEGCALFDWTPVVTHYKGRTAVIPVMARPLRIGRPGDAVQVSVSARTLQAIADRLGFSLLTSKVSDAAYEQADIKLTPSQFNATKADIAIMATTKRMLDHASAVEAKIQKAGSAVAKPLVANGGKDWILTRRWAEAPTPPKVPAPKKRAANFGWYLAGAKSWNPPRTLRVLQPIGLAHGPDEPDYSQAARGMGLTIQVFEGDEPTGPSVLMPLSAVATDPEYAGLVSDEGPLPFLRPPWAPAASGA